MFDSLLRKISNLQKDKEQLILEVEQEEEYLTNTLQHRLEQVSIGSCFSMIIPRPHHKIVRIM